MKNIPTITIIFFEEHNLYGFEYLDDNLNTQVEYGHLTLDACLGTAFRQLKTFVVLPDVETR